MKKKHALLDSTGHSFSGISDVINNRPEKIKELLEQITQFYYEKVAKQKEIEKQLIDIKMERWLAESDFIFAMKAMQKEQLTFQIKDEVVTVDLEKDEVKIKKRILIKMTQRPSNNYSNWHRNCGGCGKITTKDRWELKTSKYRPICPKCQLQAETLMY